MTHNLNEKEFRWGFLAAGGIARAFASDLGNLSGHVVAAVGSRSQQSADTWAAQFPGCTAYGSYEALLADTNIDGIYVSSPHTFHAEHSIMALKAGKPVLCEKPIAISAEQVQKMADVARDQNLLLMEAMWTRYLPHIKEIRNLLASGRLGKVISVEANHGQRLADYSNPRHFEPELGGGALLDLGIYPVSFAHMVLGKPQKITASAIFTDKSVDSHTSAIFQYSSGAQAIISTTLGAKSSNSATISCVGGRIEIDSVFYAPTSFRVVMHGGEKTEYPNTYVGHGLREEARYFAECVRTGAKDSQLLSLSESIEIMSSLDEIRRQIGLTYP